MSMSKGIKLPRGIKWAFAEGCRTREDAVKALDGFKKGFDEFKRTIREPKTYRIIGEEALDKYVGDEVWMTDKDSLVLEGELVNHVPRGDLFYYLTGEEAVQEWDFYVRQVTRFPGMSRPAVNYIPVKHGDNIKVRQNENQKRTSCVREYVFIDESD